MTTARRIIVLTAPLCLLWMAGCSSHLPQNLSDFDTMTHMVSKKSFNSPEPIARVVDQLNIQLGQCWSRHLTMFSPGPVPIGAHKHFVKLSPSGQEGQIVLTRSGVQSYLIARLDVRQTEHGTLVEAATKKRQNEELEPLFAAWIEQGYKGCKIGR
jgi:hypothetical protein